MAIDKNTIKKWFVNGAKPTQAQFWAWQDSYWHKDETISQSQIQGLAESLSNKADVDAINAKANTDATGLTTENIIAWKNALNVGELPSNIATIDENQKEGNTYTKSQLTKLLENSGKNIGNSQVISQVGAGFMLAYDYTIDTNRQAFRLANLQSAQGNIEFINHVEMKADGTLGFVPKKIATKAEIMSMPTLLTDEEKNKWFAGMNSAVSFSGTTIRMVLPPVIKRGKKHQNIVIKGLGLNLIQNQTTTPPSSKSYVGLIKPGGEKLAASNYVVVGDSQTIIAEVMINDSYPLGESRIELLNGGIPAVGDLKLKVVENIENNRLSGEKIFVKQGDINKQVLVADNSVKLFIHGNPKIHEEPVSSEVLIQYSTELIFKSNEDWWYEGQIELSDTVGYYDNDIVAELSLSHNPNREGIDNSSVCKMFIKKIGGGYGGQGIQIIDGVNRQNGCSNILTINLIKQGNALNFSLLSQNGKQINNTIIINENNDLRLNLGLYNQWVVLTKAGFYKL